MKHLIIALAVSLLMMMSCVYQVDSHAFLRNQEDLKYQADDMAAAAVLFYQSDAYGEGIKIFDDSRGNATAEVLLKENMNTTGGIVDKGYFAGNHIIWHIYYFDDSGKRRSYTNGALTSTVPFSYGIRFVEPLTGYGKLIDKPTAIVTIEAGCPHYRLPILPTAPPMIQTSAYEYVGR